jgi:hypothetical protein
MKKGPRQFRRGPRRLVSVTYPGHFRRQAISPAAAAQIPMTADAGSGVAGWSGPPGETGTPGGGSAPVGGGMPPPGGGEDGGGTNGGGIGGPDPAGGPWSGGGLIGGGTGGGSVGIGAGGVTGTDGMGIGGEVVGGTFGVPGDDGGKAVGQFGQSPARAKTLQTSSPPTAICQTHGRSPLDRKFIVRPSFAVPVDGW